MSDSIRSMLCNLCYQGTAYFYTSTTGAASSSRYCQLQMKLSIFIGYHSPSLRHTQYSNAASSPRRRNDGTTCIFKCVGGDASQCSKSYATSFRRLERKTRKMDAHKHSCLLSRSGLAPQCFEFLGSRN